jgi:hypothetical protein
MALPPAPSGIFGGDRQILWFCVPDNPQSYSLPVGTISQRATFTPGRQSWRRSALHRVDELAGVRASEKGATA